MILTKLQFYFVFGWMAAFAFFALIDLLVWWTGNDRAGMGLYLVVGIAMGYLLKSEAKVVEEGGEDAFSDS